MPKKAINEPKNPLNELTVFEQKSLKEIEELSDLKQFDQWRLINLLAKNSPLSQTTASLSQISDLEQKKELGQKINQIKQKLLEKLQEKESSLKSNLGNLSNLGDLTLPGKEPTLGTLHPITQVKTRVISIFEKMGFQLLESRLLDDYFHVFESLNFPTNHPATDIMDTFWTKDNLIPIPHTSSMQHRILKELRLPIAAVSFGRCMRFEATDQRHEHTFYQLEGIFVDQGITVADLIGTLKAFLDSFFEKDIEIKIQPSFFPFVEPALEIMAKCIFCNGKGCATCSGSGWLELIPSGMVHPNVLKMAGVDPAVHNGFAWAIGLDRLTMLLYGINDIRLFHSGDLRFLRQF